MTKMGFYRNKMNFKAIIMLLSSFILCNIINYSTGQSLVQKRVMSADHIKAALLGHHVIPDVIPKAPKKLFKVSFIDGFTPKLGNILAPIVLKFPPFFIRWPAENDTLYTMVMTDPDMPSRHQPFLREWNHWLVGNMVGPDLSTGDTIAEYLPPEPQQDSGYHRITFIVFKQPEHINFTEPHLEYERNDTRRTHFSTRKFAEKYKLGNPVAINFCLTAFNRSSIDGIDDLCESHSA
nr:PREDICTED: protein D3-like isoform X1 [Bemisia tabaci]XP_018905717.1 PREDICTED: protein D3-like isoform X1 [Bemisia tabaci]XP_018905719.1 PREDICTED: protein D3-like isoform X2 [Bemisia tabaci]